MSAKPVIKFLLIGSVVGMSAMTIAACCNSKKDSDSAGADPSASAPAPTVSAEPTATAASDAPVWKQKCPDAERQESGTVTAVKAVHIHKTPDESSEKLTTINRGTWVDLLGAKGTWLCIDYPCGVGKLCPGWVEERYSERKVAEKDAGVDAKADAPVDAAPIEAGATDAAAAVTDAAAAVKDGGLSITPAGGRTPDGTRPIRPRLPK